MDDVSGWNSGGTGGTFDFGWNSEAVLQMMAQQAQLNSRHQEGGQYWYQRDKPDTGEKSQGTAWLPLAPPTDSLAASASHATAGNGGAPPEEDVVQRLEMMVEELTGACSSCTTCLEERSYNLLEDAFSKVDAAREALSHLVSDSGLRHAAPAFVPGQLWTGSQQSSFVD